MNTAQPLDFPRRSHIYRKLEKLGASFGESNDAAIALSFRDASAEIERAQSLALCDLSPLPRIGFKGSGSAEWLSSQGVSLPAKNNRVFLQPDGALAARLSPNEALLLGDLNNNSDLTVRLLNAWHAADVPPQRPRGFPLPRAHSHAWFAVTGRESAGIFAKLCGVDLRPHAFANGTIAQTSVARLNTIVIRWDLGDTVAFHVLADSASADYLWDCLSDAMGELDGRPVGIAALRALGA